jgi:biotin operon repressor
VRWPIFRGAARLVVGAKVIILPRDRLAWHRQMAEDRGLSHVAFRVGVWIGIHFNNRTGRTFVGYDGLARDLGLSRATIAAAVKELKDRGHLDVQSGGGRHIANEYKMILKTVQISGRFETAETVQNQPVKRPEFWTTTLSSPSEKYSSRARGRLGDVFVLEDSDDANAWSKVLRSQGKSGTLLIVIHNGKRGAWMPSQRPPSDAERQELADESKSASVSQ